MHPVWALLIGSHAQVCGSSGSFQLTKTRMHEHTWQNMKSPAGLWLYGDTPSVPQQTPL